MKTLKEWSRETDIPIKYLRQALIDLGKCEVVEGELWPLVEEMHGVGDDMLVADLSDELLIAARKLRKEYLTLGRSRKARLEEGIAHLEKRHYRPREIREIFPEIEWQQVVGAMRKGGWDYSHYHQEFQRVKPLELGRWEVRVGGERKWVGMSEATCRKMAKMMNGEVYENINVEWVQRDSVYDGGVSSAPSGTSGLYDAGDGE
jgi:hypothetical protein